MSQDSSIEWTDATWNVVTGCTKCSSGCLHCYIERTPPFRMAGRKFDKKGHIPLIFYEDRLDTPLHWKKPRRVFVNSLSDLFHKDVPFDFIDKVFAVMALCPQHVFQILTKRPERMAKYTARGLDEILASVMATEKDEPVGAPASLAERVLFYERVTTAQFTERAFSDPEMQRPLKMPTWPPQWPLRNVWLGTSVENQKTADERIPHLLKVPAVVRFLSCEPLLGPIDLRHISLAQPKRQPTEMRVMACAKDWCEKNGVDPVIWSDEGRGLVNIHGEQKEVDALEGMICHENGVCFKAANRIDWVICGGESGPGARPCNTDWIRSIVEQCKAAGVACFVKQLGAFPVAGEPCKPPKGEPFYTVNEDLKLKDSKGGDISEFPDDLKVREFPQLQLLSK